MIILISIDLGYLFKAILGLVILGMVLLFTAMPDLFTAMPDSVDKFFSFLERRYIKKTRQEVEKLEKKGGPESIDKVNKLIDEAKIRLGEELYFKPTYDYYHEKYDWPKDFDLLEAAYLINMHPGHAIWYYYDLKNYYNPFSEMNTKARTAHSNFPGFINDGNLMKGYDLNCELGSWFETDIGGRPRIAMVRPPKFRFMKESGIDGVSMRKRIVEAYKNPKRMKKIKSLLQTGLIPPHSVFSRWFQNEVPDWINQKHYVMSDEDCVQKMKESKFYQEWVAKNL